MATGSGFVERRVEVRAAIRLQGHRYFPHGGPCAVREHWQQLAGQHQCGRADSRFALWLRGIEAIEVPPSPLVPGPLDMGDLPPPFGEAHGSRLGVEWLTWWISLVDRRPRPPLLPPDDVEPAHDTPDPLGLARLPVLRGHVTRRWTEFLRWRTAYHRAHGTFASRRPVGDLRDNDTVRELEATLGRRAAPFSLRFTQLPVRDDRIRPVEAAHYLVPEHVYLGAGWPAWLRAVVAEVA